MQGAQCFLNAICLNPKAEHIWNYFRQSVLQADRFDLADKINAKDIKAFGKDFKLLDHATLPKPNTDSLYSNKIFLS
jgi:hypothetical protein